MQFTDLDVENTPPPTINRVKDQSMRFNRSGCIAMVLHGKSSNIAWRPRRRDVSCRFSWKRKEHFFKSRCKNLFNFESILTLKGPGFSDFGTARGGGMESAFISNFVI